MSAEFWTVVNAQLEELKSARSAEDVVRILSKERNPYGQESIAADGFFAGSGGEFTLREALEEAGWKLLWSRAWFWYAMESPDGSVITYIEGDIYIGNRRH
ncbi:hypothetical protein ABT160_04480 [Streptomyces sp. NPDC001941]|uniref:hypothetical protein n=1 Tax=Streptomyces sp. NPDC001941 TaxID=3154659 RepID=UPI00333266E1